jgi:hypothetical protein
MTSRKTTFMLLMAMLHLRAALSGERESDVGAAYGRERI